VQRWKGLEQVPEGWGPSIVTVGVFDGVHRGHQHTVGRAAQRGVELGLPVAAVTFDPNPVEVVRPGLHPLILTAIVIGFGLLVFALTLAYRSYTVLRTTQMDEMRVAEPVEDRG